MRGGEQGQLGCGRSKKLVPVASWTTAFGFDSLCIPGLPRIATTPSLLEPHIAIFVSQEESRPWIVQFLGKRGGREWQTRSSTCRGMLTSDNAKPGEEHEEGED